MKDMGIERRQFCSRWLSNRRVSAMARFKDIKTLQKIASTHAEIHKHFNQERRLTNRETFKKD